MLLAVVAVTTEQTSLANDSGYLVLPIVLRLEGVGLIYGAGGGVQDTVGDRVDIYAAKSFGAVDALGVLATDVPIGAEGFAMTLFALTVSRAAFDTAYRRGITEDSSLVQEVSGNGFGSIVDGLFLDRQLKVTAGIAQTKVVLEDFQDSSGDSIPIPGAVLHDIDTNHKIIAVEYDRTEGSPSPLRGYRLGINAVTADGRVGQSDTLTTTYRAAGFFGLGQSLTWGVFVLGSDATVTRRETKYDTEDEVREALEIDCASVADSRKRAQCEQLEDDLSAYIAANNRYGTATPLGGSTTLRAYRELRFRAAHTRLVSTELRWRISESLSLGFFNRDGNQLEVVPFWEIGYASDQAGQLYDSSRASYGVSVRLFINNIPLRLGVAQGEEGTAWFLTAGSPW